MIPAGPAPITATFLGLAAGASSLPSRAYSERLSPRAFLYAQDARLAEQAWSSQWNRPFGPPQLVSSLHEIQSLPLLSLLRTMRNFPGEPGLRPSFSAQWERRRGDYFRFAIEVSLSFAACFLLPPDARN